jgi:hypothetical protein
VTGAAAAIIGVQDFAWGLANDSWRARVQSLPPQLFATAAADLHRGVEHEVGAVQVESSCPID